jgi:hypothetical protein
MFPGHKHDTDVTIHCPKSAFRAMHFRQAAAARECRQDWVSSSLACGQQNTLALPREENLYKDREICSDAVVIRSRSITANWLAKNDARSVGGKLRRQPVDRGRDSR